MTDNAAHVVGIVGSLRAASYNGLLLRAAVELAPPSLLLARFDIADIPLYNQDVEAHGEPTSVGALRAAVAAADAVLFVSPEYNYGVPGVLKNAIDWISRPSGKSPLQRKPAAIMGASMGPSGTMRMQLQLRPSLQALDVYAMPRPEVVISFCKDKFDAEGRLTDEKTREHVKGFMLAFTEWIHRF